MPQPPANALTAIYPRGALPTWPFPKRLILPVGLVRPRRRQPDLNLFSERPWTGIFWDHLALTHRGLHYLMRTSAITLLASLILPGMLHAGGAGTTGANFLKLGAGPRAVAMGDAQVGLADDAYATYWNPAGLAQLKAQEMAFTHTNYMMDIKQQNMAYAYPHPRYGTLAASLNYLSFGSFPGYDATGQPTSEVRASDMSLGLSYGADLYKEERFGTQLAAGVTGKWIHERLDTVSASAFAGDLGLLFAPGIAWGEWLNGWKLGMTARNLGSSMTYDRDSFALPRILAAGLSYTGNWREESITLTLDARQPNDGRRSFGTGLEVWTLQSLVVRGGYTSEGDLGNGLRIGAGVRFKTLEVNYAFASEGDLGSAHRFGLTLRFAPPKVNPVLAAQRFFQKGTRDYRRKRYTEALVDFNKALELDPSHPQALEMMKKTYEALKESPKILSPQ